MSLIEFQNLKTQLHLTKSLRVKDQTCITFELGGCLAFLEFSTLKEEKLLVEPMHVTFIGYPLNSKVYRFYDLVNQVVIESNSVDFF